jgi:hypothetical protein
MGLGIAAHELAIQLRRAAAHAEHARQQALRLEAAAHAVLHDLPDAQQSGAHFASLRQVRSRASISS